jgi:hypothetical protein
MKILSFQGKNDLKCIWSAKKGGLNFLLSKLFGGEEGEIGSH